MSIKSLYPDIRPSLNLDFANSKALNGRITFTRNSIGTYVGANGLIQTAPINSPRFDHDPVTGESLGLLIEEQRTNIWNDSADLTISSGPIYNNWNNSTRTANVATAPDGTTAADRNTFGSPTASTVRRVSTTAGTTYTFSIYLKKDPTSTDTLLDYFGFVVSWSNNGTTLTGYDLPNLVDGQNASNVLTNEWKRFSFSYTAPAGSVSMEFGISNRGSGSSPLSTPYSVLCWGAQIEAGSFPTSLIPTSGSSATRVQDIADITGTNFTNFYNITEGSLYSEFSLNYLDGGYNNTSVMINNNTENEYIAVFGHDPAYAWVQSSGGTSFGPALGSSTTTGTNYKVAMAYKLNDFAATLNGGSVSTDTSGVVPTVDRMFIGRRFSLNKPLHGTIKKLAYYPKRLTNAQLQTLTQ